MRSSKDGTRFAGRYVLLGGSLAMVAALAAYGVVSGDRRFVATGDAFPGRATSIAELVGYFSATLCGALVIGALIYVVTTASPDDMVSSIPAHSGSTPSPNGCHWCGWLPQRR